MISTRCVRARGVLTALALVLLVPAGVLAAGVEVKFDLSSPTGGPFPSDLFTVDDPSHLTGLRVNLPKPDCAARPSDCADIDVINTLDGFNLQPRLRIPFTGAIDPATATSASIFLVRLGRPHHRQVVGINQVVWDPATLTVYAESDELLAQHTRWALIVTDGVRDTAGEPVTAGAFGDFRHDLSFGQTQSHALKAYRKDLLDALAAAGVPHARVIGASVFSTQSATAVLEKIRQRLQHMTPAPASFLLGSAGERTVFPLPDVAGIQFTRQVGTAPSFITGFLPTVALNIAPGIGKIAFGRFSSPDWETAQKFIPPVGTRTGVPAVQGTNDIYFNLFLPAGTPPPGGWPVAIYGHGFTDNKNNSPLVVAAVMAARGIATIAINVVGHGGGPLGTLTVLRNGALPPVTLPAGGRGIDQDGNGTIDSTEGSSAAPPRDIIANRDGLQQTVADLMQLVRVIQVGMDADGNGVPDLDPERIYYFGQSFGGIYGIKFLAVEPAVRVGVPNVPGGAIVEIARLSPVFRPLVGFALATRVPSLINVGGLVFNENMPLRNEPPRVNLVDGAIAIQEVLENTEWVSQSGNPVAYAPHLRAHPLDGLDEKSVIIQFAKGDQTVPNPTATAILRAGDLADRATYLRNDLVFAARPGTPKNPHTFLTNIANPAVADLAIAAQIQIATFFQTDGAVVIDPDGAAPLFEVPIVPPLPETLNFIP